MREREHASKSQFQKFDVFIYINADLCASLSCCEFISASAFSLITSWKQTREGQVDKEGEGWQALDQLVSCQFDLPDACGDLSNMLCVVFLARSLDRCTQSE